MESTESAPLLNSEHSGQQQQQQQAVPVSEMHAISFLGALRIPVSYSWIFLLTSCVVNISIVAQVSGWKDPLMKPVVSQGDYSTTTRFKSVLLEFVVSPAHKRHIPI